MKKLTVFLLVCAVLGGAVFANGSQEETTVRVAAQNVNETVILGHMAKILIEEKLGMEAKINTEFSASSVLHQAMSGNEIDIYPTWTGTQLTGILRYEGPKLSPEETYARVKEGFEENFNMTWSETFGFNNTYVLCVRRETAEKYDLEKASDLAPYAEDWVLAGDENYDTRPDAHPGWSEAYGIDFKKVLPMQYGLIYRAIDRGEVDVASAYATDSRIAKLDLVMLEDDKNFFPDYSGAYVLRGKLVEKHPEILETVNLLGGEIDTATMSSLNLRYDNGDDPATIARDFLKEKGFI
jgi:glycine betaine/choline ABC-type transport system substrate-binding protein